MEAAGDESVPMDDADDTERHFDALLRGAARSAEGASRYVVRHG